jgi:hypothetical protein
MSQASLARAKQKHQQMITSREVDRGPRSSNTSISSLSKTENRPYARRTAGTPTTPYKNAVLVNQNDVDEKQDLEPWMETVTPGKFTKFQQTVYAIIAEIVNKPEHASHPFTETWKQLHCAQKNPMSPELSWYRLKRLLGIHDIFEYKNFLQKCPTIAEYIIFASSKATKNGFDFGVINRMIASIRDSSVESPSTSGTDSSIVDVGNSNILDINAQNHSVDITETIKQAGKVSKDLHSRENSTGEDALAPLTPKQNK